MRNKYRDIFLLLLICAVLVILWFRKGYMFAGGESGVPFYNLNKTYELSKYAWSDGQAGYPITEEVVKIPFNYILNYLFNIGISGVVLQASSFFLLMILGVMAVYLFTCEITGNKMTSLLASIFFILNPYSMMQVWGRGIYPQMFAFCLFPMTLYLVYLGLKRRQLLYFIILLLLTFIFSSTFSNVSYLISYVFLFGSVFIYFLVKSKSKKEILYYLIQFIFILIIFIVLHAWWLNHLLKSYAVLTIGRSSGVEHNLGTLRGVSRETPILVVLRLLHNYLIKDRNYGDIYFNLIFRLVGYLYILIIIYSLKFVSRVKESGYIAGMFFVSLFIVLGSNLPLGKIFELFFVNITPLQAFRNPYEKFGVIYLIFYSILFGIGSQMIIVKLSKNLKVSKKIVYAMFSVIIFGIYVWPMWTGQFAGGYKFNPWVKVPDYYIEANNYFNIQNNDKRIIHLPINPGDGVRYTWEGGYYQGTDISEMLFDKPSISKNIALNKPYYNVLLKRFGKFTPNAYGPDPEIDELEFIEESFIDELVKLNVGYIILHYDWDTTLSGMQNLNEVESYLSQASELSEPIQFGKLKIYEINRSMPGEIYSPEVPIIYSRNNPTSYSIYADSNDKYNLIFLNNYNDNWVSAGQHDRVYSYANKWMIDSGDHEYNLVYEPQLEVDKLFNLSYIVFVCLLFVVGIKLILK